MGLETVATIDDLNVANPVGGTDAKSQGDDHIRNIKTAVKAAFGDDATKITIKRPTVGTGGVVVTSLPCISWTQTWNGAGVKFEADKINVTDTASLSTSTLFERQVGGVSKASISKAGFLTLASGISLGDGTRQGGTIKGGAANGASSTGVILNSSGGDQLFYVVNNTKGMGGLFIGQQGVGIALITELVFGGYHFTTAVPGVNDMSLSIDGTGITLSLSAASAFNGDSFSCVSIGG